MGDKDKAFITAYCRQCQSPRYRSIRPLGLHDEAKPEYFKALDELAPPAVKGAAVCYLCQDRLVFMPDSKLPTVPSTPSQPVRNAPAPATTETFQREPDDDLPLPLPTSSLQVETLFELQPDEDMKVFQDFPDAYFIVTNRRILRIKKG